MKWTQILNNLDDNNLQPVYLLNGSEKYLINDFIKKAQLRYIPDGMSDLNLSKIDAKDMLRLRNECMTPPFMAEKRIILIENCGYFNCPKERYESSNYKELQSIVDNLLASKNNDILLIFIDDNKITASNPIVKLLKKNDLIVSYNQVTDSERADIAVKMASAENKKLSRRDAQFLVEYVGSEMFKIKNEVDKLSAYAGSTITRNDIMAVSSPSTDYNVFQMIKAITNKNSSGAFSIFRDMVRNGEYVGVILSLIARQYRVFAYIDDIDKEFGRNIDYNLLEKRLGVKHFVIKTMYNKGKSISLDDRKRIINNIIDADYLVKIGMVDGNTAIENLIFKLVG